MWPQSQGYLRTLRSHLRPGVGRRRRGRGRHLLRRTLPQRRHLVTILGTKNETVARNKFTSLFPIIEQNSHNFSRFDS